MGDNTNIDRAKEVLHKNDRGIYTVPSVKTYPHQWLWDSCFIAIGLRHYNIDRAQQELLSILRGQWDNGMLPHMLLMNHRRPTKHERIWQSSLNLNAPLDVATSGMTQPPLLAEAVWQVGAMLSKTERKSLFARILPEIIKHHEWIYRERDRRNEGIASIVHPWESGMDNSPALLETLRLTHDPLWIKTIRTLRLDAPLHILSRDIKRDINLEQRTYTTDNLLLYSLHRYVRRLRYDTHKIFRRPKFAVQDIGYNSILIKANERILAIAKDLHYTLPKELVSNMHKTARGIQTLYDPSTSMFYSRDLSTKRLIRTKTVACLLPLYSGAITQDQANALVQSLASSAFNTPFPVPSVASTENCFEPQRYWQGATWINTNWLIIQGLLQYGFTAEAKKLRESTIAMIESAGFFEYFHAENGTGLGAKNFSWTAALYVDLYHSDLSG